MQVSIRAAIGLIAGSLGFGIAGCTSISAGDAEMCTSMRTFARASLDSSGLRRAWFLPFGAYEDGAVDFYAPMASSPSDDVSRVFYERRVGQLTHYLRAPEFASTLAKCLTPRSGYARLCESQTEDAFRASFRDSVSGRLVEIAAVERNTTILVADKAWKGDLSEAFRFQPADDPTTSDKSMQPTCEDARR
jgi:hypothetical protein